MQVVQQKRLQKEFSIINIIENKAKSIKISVDFAFFLLNVNKNFLDIQFSNFYNRTWGEIIL